MAIWPFNRKQQADATLPEEIQEYYEGAQKPQRGMAWLLALGTLLLTLILACVLFFGGRWVYQQFSDDEPAPAPTSEQEANREQGQDQGTNEQTPPPSANPDQQDTSSTNTNQAPTTGDSTPATGDATEIPNTGPGPEGLQ